MCRPTETEQSSLVLERLQQRLQQQLQLSGAPLNLAHDHLAHVASRGSGPRIFCGHVPPECSEELVKAHFSQWGHVTDVYFPKRKDTFRRRPFCFVTFNRLEDAQRALAESPMNICGIPIKQLNLVEDRADYYKHRHTAAQSALVQALQTLALLGNEAAGPSGGMPPAPLASQPPTVDLNNLAALLSLETTGAQLGAPRPQQAYPMHQPVAYDTPAARYSAATTAAALPFANLPGFSQAALSTQAGAGLAMPAAAPAYEQAVRYAAAPAQPAFPPANGAALAAALAAAPGAADWSQLPTGARSPFSTLESQAHASTGSSPPKSSDHLPMGLPLKMHGSTGSRSSGSASPDLDTAAANRLAMWQLQNELLAGGNEAGSSGSGNPWGVAGAAALTAVN